MKLGISSASVTERYGYDKGFELIKKSGFDAVDVGLEQYGVESDPFKLYHRSEDEFCTFFDTIRKLAEKWELEISQTHGRCNTYSMDKEHNAYVRWVSERDLKATSLLGAPACVIHAIVSGRFPEHYQNLEFMISKNAEMYGDLAPFAEKNNVKIAIETSGRAMVNGREIKGCFSDAPVFQKMFEAVDTRCKTVCVDTGHTNEAVPFGAPKVQELIRLLGKEITILHLHDNNGTYDQHLPPIRPSRGTVEWCEVFETLDEIGYSGVYNFELNLIQFGGVMDEAVRFLGKYLRYFIENKGKLM
ncbi:MAG: sugar phosphate isomerase/epimerase [Ruminococcaceae bacterium]|nr:sugar phosphate isomerase/epimerase [Oscillospiraceae bacterium]